MTEAPQILLNHQLKTLKLPTILRAYDTQARLCAAAGRDRVQFLARPIELALIDRERRMIDRRIKAATFPATGSLDSFDFAAIPSLDRMQVPEPARCQWIERCENVIAPGPSGTGKTPVARGLGLAACQKGLAVRFTPAAAVVHDLLQARDARQLLRRQKQMTRQELLIIGEPGVVPLSRTGAELLFELISQQYARGSPPDHLDPAVRRMDGNRRIGAPTGALLDRLTHHVSILEINGDSYRLAQSKARQK